MIILQVDYGIEVLVYVMNCEGVRLVCEVVDEFEVCDGKKCWVVGSVGFINCIVIFFFDVEWFEFCNVIYDDFVVVYLEVIIGLMEGGVDLLFIEMVFDMLNVKVVLFVVQDVFVVQGCELLVMFLGIIIDVLGCMLSGQMFEVFVVSIEYVGFFLLGLNCVLGVDLLWFYLCVIVVNMEVLVLVYFNVGFFNVFGEYDEMFEYMVVVLVDFVCEGLVNIVGGCCGIIFEYIKVIVEVVKDIFLCQVL